MHINEGQAGILDSRPGFSGLCAGRDCRSGKEAALEGVVELRREGCNEAGMVRSARPKGRNTGIGKKELKPVLRRTIPGSLIYARAETAVAARRGG